MMLALSPSALTAAVLARPHPPAEPDLLVLITPVTVLGPVTRVKGN